MEKNKIMIIGLVIVIIALIAGIAIALTGNNNALGSSENSISNYETSEGMEIYNFDSAFSMEVPNGTVFLKTRMDGNGTGIISEGNAKDYFSKDNEFEIYYIESHMLNDERVNYILALDEGNVTTEQDGDLLIIHDHDASGKVGKTWETTEFKEAISIYKGTKFILIEGNDIDLIKSMAKTIKFRD
jgi:hypothetical protein